MQTNRLPTVRATTLFTTSITANTDPTATMTSPYIRKESSPFLKRVLIPFWVLRMLVMVIGLGIFGFQFGVIIAYTDEIEDYGRQYNTELPIGRVKALLGVIVVMLFINLVLEITCIVKRSRRTLSPKFFLIVNVVQTTFVVIAFIMVMSGTPAPGGIAISVVFL